MPGRKKTVKKKSVKQASGSKTAKTAAPKGRRTARTPAKPRAVSRAPGSAVALRTNISDLLARITPRPQVEFRVPVRRPLDFLVFDLIFENLKLVPGTTSATLVRDNPQKPSYFVVEFPPQSFGEQVFLDKAGTDEMGSDSKKFPNTSEHAPDKNNVVTPGEALPAMPAARIRMSGKSRLAFTMPDSVQELAYDLQSLLVACRTWPQRRDVLAAPEPRVVVRPGAQTGKAWLKDITTSAHWIATSSTLFEALQAAGPREMSRAVASAATRVGDYAATALASNRTANLAAELERMVVAEAGALAQQYPVLREGQSRDLMLAALSVRATESLASSRLAFGDDSSFVAAIPFLPIVLSPHRPGDDVISLELPYRLYLSPIESARWLHSDAPCTNVATGRTELWHTRLTTAPDDLGPDRRSKIRAIWSPDYPLDVREYLAPPLPFRMSLDPLDRQMLVKLMAGYDEKTTLSPPKPFTPRPSLAQRLHLSALGGLLDTEGTWTVRPETIVEENPLQTEVIGLEQWRHFATLGRDHYVKVVYAGYLLPFGHHASFIKVSERKFEPSDPSQPTTKRVAALRQRFFIIVREHIKTYPGAGTSQGWFDFPFPQVEIVTKVTPTLRAPDLAGCQVTAVAGQPIYPLVPNRAAFWPMLGPNETTDNFLFEIAVTDLCGHRITFAMPLLFIGDEANTGMVGQDAIAARVVAAYNAEDEFPRRTGPTNGVVVCYAPEDSESKGGTGLPTESLVFCAEPATAAKTEPHFTPSLCGGDVGIPQLQRLLGQNEPVRVEYPNVYKASGFQGNDSQLFLKVPKPRDLAFGGSQSEAKSDTLGALASPAMAIQGLSRLVGPVAAVPPTGSQTVENTLGKVLANKFNPADFFKGAKILGGIDLGSVLTEVALTGVEAPRMLTRDLPTSVEASFDWSTKVKQSDPDKLLVPGAGGDTILTMKGTMSAPIGNPQGATFEATATLTHFKVNLFGFIILWFDELRFHASRGKKPDVSVTMHPGDEAITFGGALEFVNEIRQYIPSSGFSDPPSLTVTPSGISASYSLNLPSIGVGIFSLTNASLGAGFSLPFDAQPVEVKFNFSTRDHPFSLTVSLFGGGGFFAIGIGTDGVREIEAALEFGAGISIDLGVASGGVEVKAGVYFHWLEASNGHTVELAGYVRLHGELSVLGMISASLTFNLQLSYLKQPGSSSVWGEATLVVEIDVLLFSGSVEVSCRREFGGSDADPTFVDLIPAPAVWADYCAAFAAD